MSDNRVIEYVALSELPNVEDFFERHSGIDVNDIDEKYGNAVAEGRAAIEKCCRIAMVYERLGIESHGDKEVKLSSGHTLNGKMISRVLKDADEAYLFVITVDGFSDFTADDIMVEYFGDTWATSFVESAQAMFANMVSEKVEQEGNNRTHVWCPGQTQFGLENQRPLFDVLSPEDIGCTLTRRLMMVPVKSASGVIGVNPPDVVESIMPCDFCTFKATCPASKRGCACL